MKSKNKKQPKPSKAWSVKKTAVIAGIVLFGLVVPQVVNAQLFGLEEIPQKLLIVLAEAIRFILNWLVKAASAFFQAMLKAGFDSDIIAFAKAGWSVIRDFSNMFFILFLVVIAFATILRIEQYGIKQLLPKVILIALLINFSFVIASVIVDFSNIAANFFIDGINKMIQGIPGQKEQGIAAAFSDSFGLGTAYITFEDCDKYEEIAKKYCDKEFSPEGLDFLPTSGAIFLGKIMDKALCKKMAEDKKKECETYGSITVPGEYGNFLNLLLGIIVGGVVMLIAAFTLFAGGVLLLIRVIAIWFLMMVVPFAFICYIMPGLRRNWQRWWSTFLSWCFFAPAYAFFVWIAMQIAITHAHNRIAKNIKAPIPGGDYGPGANMFITNPAESLISFAIIVGFLLGGLIVARQMGIYGANVAIQVGQKWGRGAGRWVARKTTRYPKELGAALGAGALEGAGKALKQIPGFKKFGRGLEAKGKILMRKPEESEEVKRYEKRARAMADKDLLADVKTQIGVLGLTATKVAADRGLLKKDIDRDAVDVGAKTLKAYGYVKEANELLESRVDAVKDKKEREKTMDKAIAKGVHKDWREAVLKGPEGELVVDYIAQKEPTISDVIKVLKELRKDAQQVAKASLKKSFIDDFTDKANIRRREVYGAYTGEVHVAFTDSKGGVNESALEHFVRRMKPTDFRDLDLASIPYLAKYVDASAAAEMGRHISGEMKRLFAEEFNKKDEAFKKVLKKVPGWASFIT